MPNVLPAQVLGVSHVAGKYNFTDEDFLNEGADVLHEMGCRVIKVWLSALKRSYPFNSTWPEKVDSLVEMARIEYFRKLFDKPFDTYVLETFSPRRKDDYWRGGMSPDQIESEKGEMNDLAAHFLETYKESGKTFILQNWEGDWALRGGAPGTDPSTTAVKGMIDWFNARQDGVDVARKAAGERGVKVLHAAEVNHVARAMKGEGVTVTNDVLPHTHCDLYSYSAWDVPTHESDKFCAALDHLASKGPGGHDKIYVGEFGAPENVVGGPEKQRDRTKSAVETAMRWSARYAIYWELYCNEPKAEAKLSGKPKNDDMRGFWLIRPDGSRPPVTDYFIELWNRQ
jgi:hypothetical protein